MQHFTRREAIILSRTSASRLSYLARTGVVVPRSQDDSSTASVYYTWEQILELRAIRHLRRQVSLQTIRKILAFLERSGCDRALHDKQWVIDNGEVNWLLPQNETLPQIVKVATKANRHVGQLQLMASLSSTDGKKGLLSHQQSAEIVDFTRFRQRVVPFRPR